ncbi:MAG: hypothetical protein Q7T39_22360 [Polaromonas sp.]|nr:hypothetical protein [Polaromonas sp.]
MTILNIDELKSIYAVGKIEAKMANADKLSVKIRNEANEIYAMRKAGLTFKYITDKVNEKFVKKDEQQYSPEQIQRLLSNWRSRGVIDDKVVADLVEQLTGKRPVKPKAKAKAKAKPGASVGEVK